MRKMTLLLFIIGILLFPSFIVFASETEQNWNKINNLADHVLQLGKQQKYEEAKKIIANFSTIFLKAAAEKELTLKETKMVIYSYEQAESALNAVNMHEEERFNKLLQFRLTVNAVTNEHQPIWRDTEKFVLDPLNHAVKALEANERNQFQMHLNEFLSNYEVIRPSLVIDLPKHEAERYDSYIKFLEHYRNQLEEGSNKNKQLSEIQREFQLLFKNEKHSSADPELLGLIYTLGSIIAVTLIYVGWRKYKGNKHKKRMKEQDKS